MDITFGIITSGNDEFINKTIDSIEAEQIPNYEVIIVGAFSGIRKNTIVIPFDLNISAVSIKKMMIAEKAKYPILVLLHDYIRLKPGFYDGFVRFGSDWDVASCQILQRDGKRGLDWLGLPNDSIYGNVLLPYDYSNPKGQYVPGNFFIVKKDFLIKYPFNVNLIWGESEDIEWSKRIFGGIYNCGWFRDIFKGALPDEPSYEAVYKMNIYSAVEYLKEKKHDPLFDEKYDLHSTAHTQPPECNINTHLYMRKRLK